MNALYKFSTLTNGDYPGITPDEAIKVCEQIASVSNLAEATAWYKLALEIKKENQ